MHTKINFEIEFFNDKKKRYLALFSTDISHFPQNVLFATILKIANICEAIFLRIHRGCDASDVNDTYRISSIW